MFFRENFLEIPVRYSDLVVLADEVRMMEDEHGEMLGLSVKAHKKGVGLIKSIRDRSKETAIASPPILGIGFMWTLRVSGKSRIPIKRAILLERGVKMRDSKRAV